MVKRYDIEQPDRNMGFASMREEPQIGDWVRYEDYEAQAADLTRLRARIDAADKLAEVVEASWAHDGEPTNADVARILDALSAYEDARE